MNHRTFIIVVLALLGTFSACSPRHDHNASSADSSTVASTESYYTCPMHPSVRSDRPGACPVCGMALVKRTVGETPATTQSSVVGNVSLSPAQMVLANVKTETVVRWTLEHEISSVGVVSVAEPLQATIAARFRGRVEKLYANYTGVSVKKGQPLFELYSPDITSAAQDYILSLDALRSSIAPSGPHDGSAQDRIASASKTRLQNHFGMTDRQISSLEKSRVTPMTVHFDSPIRGTVLSKNVQEGQYVDEGMVLYQLADLSKVWMYLDIYEQNMRYVRLGQGVTVTSDAYPGEEFHGEVTFIDPTMNSETRTLRVRTEFPNPDLKLKPNMFVAAHIRVPIKDALVLPNSAILQTGKRSVVWVEVKENSFEPRDVVVGSTTDSQSEILEGLHEGEVVAASGGFLIDSESQLNQSAAGDVGKQHVGHQQNAPKENDPVAQPSQHKKNAADAKRTVNVNIRVEGSYAPDIIKLKVGQNLRLHFYRDEDSECTSEVVFEDFGIRKFLPSRDTVLIEITPKKTGTIDFHCGMGMVHGKIIVSK